MRVLVAMSGGVDSSVAAARLVAAGHDVVGVTLHLWDYPDDGEKGRCCAPEDQHDARRAADHLKIPHFSFDRRELFRTQVVEPFVASYLGGETPSPCVACNRTVKLRELLPLAERLGAEAIATGHYARVVRTGERAELHRGRDRQKDQSYFLHMLREDELRRVMFPLGDATKAEVRAEALARGLPGAQKGESQELCFVTSGRYDAFVEERADGRVRPGPILSADGDELGRHGGVHRFTIGQRKGLGVAVGKPQYVVGLDAETGAVQLGGDDELFAARALLAEPAFADDVVFPLAATVQVRSRHDGAQAVLERRDGRLEARFVEPVRAVSPGQVLVAYDGERVLGGATIVRAVSLREARSEAAPQPLASSAP